jgi:DNA-binding NtrC family response regulator
LSERILVVDDERLTRDTLVECLRDEHFQADSCASAYDALEVLQREEVNVVLTDLRMPSMGGDELHRRVRERWPDTDVIIMTAFGTVASAVKAMREGAADYLTKPVDTDELIIRLRRILQRQREMEEIRRLRLEAEHRTSFGELTYRSPGMGDVVDRALAVADTDVTVLVQGETGTGKEVLCRAIHAHSRRAAGPFVVVNCAGLNPNLIESELFGHEAGAFTGATHLRKGRLEIAGGGTLFIDDVDDLSHEVQVRLLRFLQDRTFERVGSSKLLHADVRVLCATKVNLRRLVDEGVFREDLYYRINTVVIAIPPLRDRKEDVPALVELFRREGYETADATQAGQFSPEALRAFLVHEWPGNVRELKHAVEHALAFARGGVIERRHLPPSLHVDAPQPLIDLHLPDQGTVSLPELLEDCERRVVGWALARAGGNQVRAAELLSIPRTTLRSRLASLREDDPAPPNR